MGGMRRLVDLGVVGLSVALVLRTWVVAGLLVPLEVCSGSMALALLGPHRSVECRECGLPFDCEADQRPVALRAVCPNCGYAGNDLARRPDVRGDRVLVDRATYRFRAPSRWEVIALRHPEQPAQACVKRLVGLPGETVQILDGDVHVNGRIQRKPWSVQRAMAVPVHDARYRARHAAAAPRWRPETSSSGWTRKGGGAFHDGRTGEAIDWLVYHHQARLAGQSGGAREVPVTDDGGYRQTRARRIEEVSPVGDVLLVFRVGRMEGSGRLWVRAADGRATLQVGLGPGEAWPQLHRNGEKTVPKEVSPLPGGLAGREVAVAICDCQLTLAIDDRPVLRFPYQAGPDPRVPQPRPLAIGSQGLQVDISPPRVYRDLYYTRPIGPAARFGLDRPVRLGDDEYYVLGDNSPFSQDSRTWSPGPGVPSKSLIGKVFLVHLPARHARLFGRDFQVPDAARIRYIR